MIFNPSNLKDEKWDSWTCTLGWPVQGIWPDVPDGNNVNAAHKAKKYPVLAIVTERGEIKLYHYPCLTKRAEWVSGFGFSNALSNVRFTCDDSTMITIGRDTRTIAQWKVRTYFLISHPRTLSLAHLLSLTHAHTHSLIHTLTHSLTHTLTHSLTHSPTRHSLTHHSLR